MTTQKNLQKKLRLIVLYGGRSGEHEISLRSAASVLRYLDRSRFDIVPVAIDKDGRWLLNEIQMLEKAKDVLPVYKDAPSVVLLPDAVRSSSELVQLGSNQKGMGVDVVFPVVHGTLCEDGTLQGLLEMADVPYVGCGVLASAVSMDKDVSKRLMSEAGLPIVPYICLKNNGWKADVAGLTRKVGDQLGYPVFVKPANAGSSLGVHKVKSPQELVAALEDAFQYDLKVLIEKAVSAREIEMSVLENPDPNAPPLVSIPGEIAPTHEFYSYEAKYLDEKGAKLMIPAPLDPGQLAQAQSLAQRTFQAVDGEGMARVDLFLDRVTGEFFVNELNTLPGFTSISMYPKLWEQSGIAYTDLLSRLIDLALARHTRRKKLSREYIK